MPSDFTMERIERKIQNQTMVTKHTWNTVKIANPGAELEISPIMPQQLACVSQTFLKGKKMQSKYNDRVKEGRGGLS